MDMTASIAPKSDQLNAEDLLTGPRTFTIEKVEQGTSEQPVNVHLVEFPGRPFKPSKTVRRLMVAAWGPDTATYPGKRMTLYRDPAVKFGGMDVGGIRVSHMSGITKRLVVALTITRGKRAPYTVEPLPDATPPQQTSPVVDEHADGPEPVTPAQMKALHASFNDAGITEREVRLDYCRHLTGRALESSKDLTRREAHMVLDALKSDTDK